VVALVLDRLPDARTPPARRAAAGRATEDAASIAGRVMRADGLPLEGVAVEARATGDGGSRAQATTDAAGYYEIAALPAGTYRVRARRSGYPSIDYGQSRSLQEGRTLRLGPRARVEGIDMVMPRGSAITGSVTD